MMKLVAGLPLPGIRTRMGWGGGDVGAGPRAWDGEEQQKQAPRGAGPWLLCPGTKWGTEETQRHCRNRSLSFLRVEGASGYFRRRGREEGRVDQGVQRGHRWRNVQESRLECLSWASLSPDPHPHPPLAPSLTA